jgi:hypothetical protein
MDQSDISEGDLVKVTDGVYTDAVGVVVDIQPECSVMRIHSKGGNVYAHHGAVRILALPEAVRISTTKELMPLPS